MNSEKYHKFVVPLNHWKQLKCNRKELDRLQLYPEYKWGFCCYGYASKKYDLGFFLQDKKQNDIYLIWKYVPWMPNYKHFWVIYKNMVIRKLKRFFLIKTICIQRDIPKSVERMIKKFLLS